MALFDAPVLGEEEDELRRPSLAEVLDGYSTEDKPKRRSLADELGDAGADKAGSNLGLAQDLNPDKEAAALTQAKESGLPVGAIREDVEGTAEKMIQAAKAKALLPGRPGLAKFLQTFDNAALVRDDIPALAKVEDETKKPPLFIIQVGGPDAISGIGRVVNKLADSEYRQKLGTAFKTGRENVQLANLGYSQLLGDESPETQAAIDQIESGRRPQKDEGVAEKVGTAVAEQLPLLGNISAKGAKSALIFGMATGGAAALAELGPQIVTAPAVVPAATFAGAVAGYKAGSAEAMFALESGLAYVEFKKMTDENGQVIDESIAKVAAAAVGAANAGLEYVAFGALLKTIPGSDKLLGKVSKESVGQMLKNPSVRAALKDALKKYGGAVTTETITEAAQEAVNVLLGWVAQRASEKIEGTKFAPTDWAAEADRIVEAGAEGFYATVGLAAPGPTVSVVTEVGKVARAQTDTQQFSDHMTAINTAVNNTKIKERSPEKTKELLEAMGVKGDVFITPEGVQTLFQTDPEAAKDILTRIGLDPDEALQAAEAGQTVRAKASLVHSQLAAEEFGALAQDLKPSPGAYSQREAGNGESVGDLAALADSYAEAMKDEEALQEELVELRSMVFESVKDHPEFQGINPEEYADAYIQGVAAGARRLGLQGQQKPADLIKKIKVQALQFDEAAAGTNEFAQTVDTPVVEAAAKVLENPNFINWFGKSTAVDEQGKPKVFLHGTKQANFEAFDPDVSSQSPGLIFFTEDPEFASLFSTAFGNPDPDTMAPAIIPVYLKAEKTFTGAEIDPAFVEANFREIREDMATFGGPEIDSPQEYIDLVKKGDWVVIEKSPTLLLHLKKQGYDSLKVVENGVENIAVFEPTQIKSIYNQGTFDPVDPRMLYQENEALPEDFDYKSPYTLKIFNDPMLKGKEGQQVKLETIIQVMRQKGISKIEKEVVGQVLASEMLHGKTGHDIAQKLIVDGNTKEIALKESITDISLDYSAFKATVENALMPVTPLETKKWMDYGASNVGFVYDKAVSIVYNSPIEHGFGDHFASIFQKYGDGAVEFKRVEYEVAEVPQRPGTFVAIDKNRPPGITDPEELDQYIETAGSRRAVEEWIEDYNSKDNEDLIAGVFGHVRRWYKGNGIFMAEIQSDFYQKKNPEKMIGQMVLADPKTKEQKKLAKKYKKAQKVIENSSKFVKAEFERAEEIFQEIKKTKAHIAESEKYIERLKSETSENPDQVVEDYFGKQQAVWAELKNKLDSLKERKKLAEKYKDKNPERIDVQLLEEYKKVTPKQIKKAQAAVDSMGDYVAWLRSSYPATNDAVSVYILARQGELTGYKINLERSQAALDDITEGRSVVKSGQVYGYEIYARTTGQNNRTYVKTFETLEEAEAAVQDMESRHSPEDGLDVRITELSNLTSGSLNLIGKTEEEIQEMYREGLVSRSEVGALVPIERKALEHKKAYEKHFYANRDMQKIENTEVAKTFTPIQKQFVAHRKNYSERMIREEIRNAALEGAETIYLPTPKTMSVIEGYINTRGERAPGDMNVGMYEVIGGDPDAGLERDDRINYGGVEYTVVDADQDSIEAVTTYSLDTTSLDSFVDEMVDSEWSYYTLEELPDSFPIVTYDSSDENQLTLPGIEPQERPDGHLVHTDENGIEYYWMLKGRDDGYYGYLSDANVIDKLENFFENEDIAGGWDNLVESRLVNEDGSVSLRAIEDELKKVNDEKVRERYQDGGDLEEHFDGRFLGIHDGWIYLSEEEPETFPQPSEIRQDEDAVEVDVGAEAEDFDIESLPESYQGIGKTYEEMGKTLQKLLPDTFGMYKDPQGYWWYKADVPAEKATEPVQLFHRTQRVKRGSVTITDDQYLVSLFDKANPSTLFHETGHIFLNEMKQIVESGDADKQFQKDYQSTYKWLYSEELKRVKTLKAKTDRTEAETQELGRLQLAIQSGEFTTDQLEKFARGFEAYLMEGKAPTLELEGAFSKFRRWLVEVYKTAKNLNVNLTDEMRGVFDRLLSVETEVDAAIQAYGMSPKSTGELNALGVNDDDQAYMKRLIQQARTKAESAMMKDRNKSRKRNLKRWAIEAEAQATRNPIYQVIETISKGKGLDRDALVDEFGENILTQIPANWHTQKGGVLPSEIAAAAGFDEAGIMLDQIMAAPPKAEAIKSLVAQKQAEHDAQFKAEDYVAGTAEYGDYMAILDRYYKGPVKDAETEVSPTTEKTGKQKPAKTISRQAFTKFARKTLNVKSVRDAVRSDLFMSAMKKAQREERKALLRGDMRAASAANDKARLNYEMAGQAVKNRKEVEKIIKRAKAAAGSKSVELRYREAVRRVVQRFQVVDGVAPQKPDNLTPLTDLIKGDEFTSSFPASDFLINDTTKDFRDLSFAELREVDNLIKFLTAKGRDERKAFLADGKTTVEEAAEASAIETADIKNKKVFDKFNPLRKLTNFTRGAFARLDSLNFIMIAKGGYQNIGAKGTRSLTEQHIIDPLIQAKDSEDVMNGAVYDQLQPHLDQIFQTIAGWRKKYGRKMVIKNAPTPSAFQRDGQTGWWTGDQIFAIALNMGNQGNIDRLMNGYPDLNQGTIDQLLSLFEKEDWDAVQGVWDVIETLYPQIDKVHVKLNNFHMNKVEAKPFRTPHGDYRGGYYPASFDPKFSNKVTTFTEADNLISKAEALHQVPATKSGMTKVRKEGVSLPLKLSLSVATSHIRESVHYITHAEALRDVDRITRHPAFAEETERVLGRQVYDMIRPALESIARPQRKTVDRGVENTVSWFRSRTTAFMLAWNAQVAAKQMFSSPAAAFDMGPKHYAKGFAAVLKSPANSYQMMTGLSPYMAQRTKSMDRELHDAFRKLDATQRSVMFGDKAITWDDVRNMGFAPIRMVDMATVLPIWHGAYQKKMAESNGDITESVAYADDLVRRTQPSAQPLDLTRWQSLSGIPRFFSSFQTFTVGKYGQRQRLHYRAWRNGKMTKKEYAFFNLCDVVVPSMAMNLLLATLYGRDLGDDDTYKGIAEEMLKYLFLTGVPIVGQFFSDYGNPLDSPLARGVELLGDVVNDVAGLADGVTEDEAKKLMWDLFEWGSFQSGVPVSRIVQKFQKGLDQKDENIPGVKYFIPAPKK